MIISKIEVTDFGTPEEDMHFMSAVPECWGPDKWASIAACFVQHCARNAKVEDVEGFADDVRSLISPAADILKRHN